MVKFTPVPPDSLPFLVVIKITPLPALEPYKEVDAASFNIVIDSISAGLISPMLPLYIVPSTTYKGALDALTEPNPRIRIEEDSPGCPVAAVT